MAVPSIQITQSTQRLRAIYLVYAVFLVLFCAGCQSDPGASIYGRYTIDLQQLSQSTLLESMAPERREIAERLAGPMAATTEYIFRPDGCARAVRGDESPIPCKLRRVEKSGTVVFWSQDRLGHTQFIRLSPTEFGLSMDVAGLKIPLKPIGQERPE